MIQTLRRISNNIIIEDPIDEWFLALNELKQKDRSAYEEIARFVDKEWISSLKELRIDKSTSPYKLVVQYIEYLAKNFIIKREEFVIEGNDEKILIQIQGENALPVKRAEVYTLLIETFLEKPYDYSIKSHDSDEVYKIELIPAIFKLKVLKSIKVARGSIKVSDKDLKKLGVDLVDEVTISIADSTKKNRKKTMNVLLFGNSKIRSGFAIMNVLDVINFGIKENDMIIMQQISQTDQY